MAGSASTRFPSGDHGHPRASDQLTGVLRFELGHSRQHQRLQEFDRKLPHVGQLDETFAELVAGGLDLRLLVAEEFQERTAGSSGV